MKNFFLVLVSIVFIGVIFSCTTDNAPESVNSPSISKIALPPSTQPTTVVIVDKNGTVYDIGIQDKMLEDGSTINQKIQDCINNSRNHGDFVSCMAHLTNWLLKNGYITNKEKGIIMNIAARADIP
ncbi:hypothetical protein D9V84_08100 [Bacteroidetes/Chlorobi group bacterium Naka2016]|jgi:hemolysin activation/secretion protein|nr:MAG: hypothetical protein D9V84_08100 [Bacteroidetes/Chlorobi group bacterium Naka2016]